MPGAARFQLAGLAGAAALILLVSLAAVLLRIGDDGEQTATGSSTNAGPGRLETAFRPTDGFTFEELPPRVTAEMGRTLAAVEADPELKEALRGIAGRAVTKGGSAVGVVLALDIDDQPGFREGFLRDAPAAIGPNPRDLTVDGQRVVSVVSADGLTMLVYYREGLAIFVGGSNDLRALEQVMTVVLENAT